MVSAVEYVITHTFRWKEDCFNVLLNGNSAENFKVRRCQYRNDCQCCLRPYSYNVLFITDMGYYG